MTLRNTPLSGRNVRISAPDLPDVLSEIFLQKGLEKGVSKLPDGQITLIRLGKFAFQRKGSGCEGGPVTAAGATAMLSTMTIYRHLLVCLLALALTVGTGWQSCATLQHLSPIAPMDQMASHADAHQHHHHMSAQRDDGLGGDHAASVAHENQPASDAHACLKCCGICMLTSVSPRTPDWAVAAIPSRIDFAFPGEQLRGHIVFVDPDIPKQIV
jgi:hypothetical protein